MEIITVVLSIFALIISFISLYSSWKVQTANESQIRADRNISIDRQLGLYGKPIAELHGINLDEAEKHAIAKEAISYLIDRASSLTAKNTSINNNFFVFLGIKDKEDIKQTLEKSGLWREMRDKGKAAKVWNFSRVMISNDKGREWRNAIDDFLGYTVDKESTKQ